MDNLGTIIVIAVLVAVMMNIVGALGPLLAGRTRTYIEKATDAHEAVYRKRKMSARLNMSGIRPRRVIMSGDDYHSPTYVGRLYGVIPANPVSDIFVRRSRFGKIRWYAVPTALISGWMSRDLYIDAVGSVAMGNFYKPIWPARKDVDVWHYASSSSTGRRPYSAWRSASNWRSTVSTRSATACRCGPRTAGSSSEAIPRQGCRPRRTTAWSRRRYESHVWHQKRSEKESFTPGFLCQMWA